MIVDEDRAEPALHITGTAADAQRLIDCIDFSHDYFLFSSILLPYDTDDRWSSIQT